MNEKNSKILLLVGYCIPYVFLCMYGDAAWGSGLVYGVAAAVLAVLCVVACKTGNIKLVVVGNIISYAVSELCVILFAEEKLSYYYESLNVHMLIGVCTVIAAMLQAYLISRLTDDRTKHDKFVDNRRKANMHRKFFKK